MQGLAVLSFLIFQFSSEKKLTNLGVPPLGNPGFTDVNIKGWIIKFSGGSRISSRGVPTPEFGPKTYYLTRFLPKTAWKWKKFDWCAFLAGLTWVKSCLASFASWGKSGIETKKVSLWATNNNTAWIQNFSDGAPMERWQYKCDPFFQQKNPRELWAHGAAFEYMSIIPAKINLVLNGIP